MAPYDWWSGSAVDGLQYRPYFLKKAEEQALLDQLHTLEFAEARYLQYIARRRIVSFGGRYDFSRQKLLPAPPIPDFLLDVRRRLGEWVGVAPERFSHGLIAEYRPGTPLGWHRDAPVYEMVAGISLAGTACMRFRPYPPPKPAPRSTLELELESGSAYVLRDQARWHWQHCITPTRELRYSITFRSLRVPELPEE